MMWSRAMLFTLLLLSFEDGNAGKTPRKIVPFSGEQKMLILRLTRMIFLVLSSNLSFSDAIYKAPTLYISGKVAHLQDYDLIVRLGSIRKRSPWKT